KIRGPLAGDFVTSYRLTPEVTAKAYRVYIVDFTNRIEFRWMLYGCWNSSYNDLSPPPQLISGHQTAVSSTPYSTYYAKYVNDGNRLAVMSAPCWVGSGLRPYIAIDLERPRFVHSI
uniref:ZP domain-containing protein n=1 Tax=Macrostomum lignano TaxID=282301 RepID=A0A1I8G667_9PLAT